MRRTTLDNGYILDELCMNFKKKLHSEKSIDSEPYIVIPKSKTMYIVNRQYSEKTLKK